MNFDDFFLRLLFGLGELSLVNQTKSILELCCLIGSDVIMNVVGSSRSPGRGRPCKKRVRECPEMRLVGYDFGCFNDC